MACFDHHYMTHLRRPAKFVAGLLMAVAALLLAAAGPARAFSQEGHMVTGAIAFEQLRATSPRTVERVLQLMAQHPDRGTFQVAVGRATGDQRALRVFMEMARWPDDIRKGEYDHPTWHYASRPLVDPRHPPPGRPEPAGSAAEAFALNLSVARDTRAPAADRAVALCWILHLAGDIHQPLHAADFYSAEYPDGDAGGNLRYVLDPETHEPMSLHWFWDQAVNRAADASAERALQLVQQFPRANFPQWRDRGSGVSDFAGWAAESYALARDTAYTPDLLTGTTAQAAAAMPAAYVVGATEVARRQATLSGYRIAELLRSALPD